MRISCYRWSSPVGIVLASLILVACTGTSQTSTSTTSSTGAVTANGSSGSGQPSDPAGSSAAPSTAPTGGGTISADSVQAAVGELDTIVKKGMDTTTVPGVAVAVVYQGKVLVAKGYGLREVGRPETVDADTVFQLASVSKPLGATALAVAVTQGKLSWDDPIQKGLPDFRLADPWVSSHVTIADMYSHRSGLPSSDHSSDILEDLGYNQQEIFDRLRLDPLAPFRDSYAYSNYGLTSGGESAAAALGESWQDLVKSELYDPLGMTATNSTFAGVQAQGNRAALHKKTDGTWVPELKFDIDNQAPAGGASSSVNDLSKWMTMLLAGGVVDGKQFIDEKNLLEMWGPQIARESAAKIGLRTPFYGFGWNVEYDSGGRLVVQHSGAFSTGAATNVLLVPAEGVGIITLTNGDPVGLPEAVNNAFLDQVKYGQQTKDWLTLYGQAFSHLEAAPGTTDFTKPPATVAPAGPNSTYVGTYANDYWGPITVTASGADLAFSIGPESQVYPLTHYTGDQFFFTQRGESGFGLLSGAPFAKGADGTETLTIDAWNVNKLGVFTRAS